MSEDVKQNKKIVADHLGIEEKKCKEASFIDDLSADSWDY